MLSLTLEGRTWAHPLPVGVKLSGLLIATMALFPVTSLGMVLMACGAVFVLMVSLGAAARRQSLKMLRPLAFIMAVILLYHLVIGQGMLGLVVVVKLGTLIALANLVTMTSRLDDILALVLWLLTPLALLGVNTKAVALGFALVIRFIPVLTERGANLVTAWRARSPRKPGWRVTIPLCLAALDDADRVAEALRARGGIEK